MHVTRRAWQRPPGTTTDASSCDRLFGRKCCHRASTFAAVYDMLWQRAPGTHAVQNFKSTGRSGAGDTFLQTDMRGHWSGNKVAFPQIAEIVQGKPGGNDAACCMLPALGLVWLC